MSKKRDNQSFDASVSSRIPTASNEQNIWQAQIAQVAERFNRQYRGEAFDLPAEVEAMPIFRDWISGKLPDKVASPFWEIARPQKNQRCLDIGCGVSFLVYPWRDWDAFFYGLEISTVARDALNARGSQLNSKLFKGVELGPAHQLNYPSAQFDMAIATGWSCYFPLDYWITITAEVKRVLKPGGLFVFDILDPQQPLAEDWAVLETYLGAEVFLEPIAEWENTIKATGTKVVSQRPGELFNLFKVSF
ncbi:MAG: class I SAM-dependent methyltransferase [Chroococcidiopsidaceae cyanobacterium CP_BM_ER_R8_30]|nr:class I SAM-dependent methyltransferase [Chroococcidiopsidaceae cyanobacterium CP_BM_ER_R8_30]